MSGHPLGGELDNKRVSRLASVLSCGLAAACLTGCAYFADLHYYSPEAGDRIKTFSSSRFPTTVDGPPNKLLVHLPEAEIAASFAYVEVPVALGFRYPFPVPFFPAALVDWSEHVRSLHEPILLLGIAGRSTSLTFTPSEVILTTLPAQEVLRPTDVYGVEGTESTRLSIDEVLVLGTGEQRDFALYFRPKGSAWRLSALSLQLGGLAAHGRSLAVPEARFQKQRDFVLF